MNYICPACGSSLDAGERCSCGARDKPVTMQVMSKEEHLQMHLGLRTGTVIYDEFKAIQKELLYQQAIQATAAEKKRKGIYEEICRKTEKSQ